MEISTPGRICLFGEHQDYLGLPIIAMAISLRSYITGEKVDNQQVTIHNPDLNDSESLFLDNLDYDCQRDYYKSGIKICLNEGLSFSHGFNCEVSSNIPFQGGTSSSSAIMVSWIHFLSRMADEPADWDLNKIAELSYKAETLYSLGQVYKKLGKMDRSIEFLNKFKEIEEFERNTESLIKRIRLHPDDITLRLKLANLYEDQARVDQALMVLRGAVYLGSKEAENKLKIILVKNQP